MARIPIYGFRLFTAGMVHGLEEERNKRLRDIVLPEWYEKRLEGLVLPIALRWVHDGNLGFPRQPFAVWKRRSKYNFTTYMNQQVAINGTYTFQSTVGDLYVVGITFQVNPGANLRIELLDQENRIIPGKGVTVTASSKIQLKAPFIRKVQITGSGAVTSIIGVQQMEYANLKDWELIQQVGLPYQNGEINSPDYEPKPQFGDPARPLDGVSFAKLRLLAGFLLHQNMPATGDPLVGQPDWPAPDPGDLLFFLREAPESTLEIITKCLQNTDDFDPDPARRQPAFLYEQQVDGLRQDGYNGNVRPAKAQIPVLGTSMLAVGTDNYSSLGLGYGTYDFVNEIFQDNDRVGFDYMVTNIYQVLAPPPFNFKFKLEYAALSEDTPAPDTPIFTTAERQSINRPLQRNDAYSESVRLQYTMPAFLPQGNGIVRAFKSNPTVLNKPRNLQMKGFLPFIPPLPEVSNAPDALVQYIDSALEMPDTGVLDYKYFVARIDVFGRWSPFAGRPYQSVAIAPQKPGLLSATLKHNEPLPPANIPDVPATLEIEFSWDWAERALAGMEFGGGFFPYTNPAAPNFTTQFALHSSNSFHPLVRVDFDPAGNPSSAAGVVTEIPNPGPDPVYTPGSSQLRRYRLTMTNMTAVFPMQMPPLITLPKVAYSILARAQERMNNGNPRPEFSVWVNGDPDGTLRPLVAYMDNPRPPVMVSLPANVRWTALPDATRTARGKLDWPHIAGAAGYVVWQAGETALREMLGLAHHPDQTYVQRATELRDYLLDPAHEEASFKAFTRLNRDLIKTNSTEIELPGFSDVLYLYRISAMSAANMESNRSNVVFFAVPRLNRPSPPGIKVKSTNAGIEIMGLESPGVPVQGFRVYRVRKALASNELNMKGLPVFQDTDPSWQPASAPVPGGTRAGKKILDVPAARSWKPYYYQVSAIGEEDATKGHLPGESPGSPTEGAFFPPQANPQITVSSVDDAAAILLEIGLDFPIEKLAIGTGNLEIAAYLPDTPGSVPKRKTLIALAVDRIPKINAAYTLTTPPLPADLASRPEVVYHQTGNKIYVRLDPSLTTLILKAVDPLGRSTDVRIDI